MAKDKAKKPKGARREKARERREKRFLPRPTASPVLVYAAGALGALAMGAGAWAQYGSLLHEGGPEPLKLAPYILAAGAFLVGIAIWFGSSGEPVLRVGDGGVAVEKGGLRRVPWYGIDRIEFRDVAVRVIGKDDAGAAIQVVASLTAHGSAAAAIVNEARARVPAVVDVPQDVAFPETFAGEERVLEPPQVVGKHCATSGTVIAYEPDARVCPRCERVYHKAHVPPSCACGASLADLLPSAKAG
jgi:hypothetical protein